jgi:hypothetical protein
MGLNKHIPREEPRKLAATAEKPTRLSLVEYRAVGAHSRRALTASFEAR